MDDFAGRVLADRYRLPLPPSDEYELAETRAFDTYSGQEVLVRQVPLPEVVEAEVLDAEGRPEGFVGARRTSGAARRSADPAVRRAIEAAQAAARIPDHPRLDQVFDVFAEGGSLWIVSEYVAARPLAALLAERPLTPYRAAEVGADVLTALRALHAHGWVHRNITTRTVLVCDDGRVVLTGLASGAAEEALCGYDPVPESWGAASPGEEPGPEPATGRPTGDGRPNGAPGRRVPGQAAGAGAPYGERGPGDGGPEASARTPGPPGAPGPGGNGAGGSGSARAARAGAIAAYQAGARAAARVSEGQRPGSSAGALPVPRADAAGSRPDVSGFTPGDSGAYDTQGGAAVGRASGAPVPHGRIADPYGVASHSPQALGPARANPLPGPPGALEDTTGAREDAPDPGWDGLVDGGRPRGPATALAAERARQARMTVVGPVTERWAPEQAGAVHENWQLAAPIGPSTDLWALGALLFRAVQGHAPYPEESTPELVQLVCAEPPAFAEECGPLRPVVESLLRQDPTERPDFEELRGWLRSLVRSAPEPEAGAHVIPAPPVDPSRLPIVRRRGELVRKRRAAAPATTVHGAARHKRARQSAPQGPPRRLGRTLLLLILLGLAAAIAYAMVFMPKAESKGAAPGDRRMGGRTQPSPGLSADAGSGPTADPTDGNPPARTPGSQRPQTTGPDLPKGFALRKDPAGFEVAVATGWTRRPENGQGQVVYAHGDFELIVVPGRDRVADFGSDPLTYQREKERELQPFRDSSWATSSGLRRIDVGASGRSMAEGQFTWQDSGGGEIYVRNLAVLAEGRYHVVQVRGPEGERDEVTRLYEQAAATYQVTK
ncbi:protein kinase [Streptomyces sp. NPDC002004]